MSSSGKRAAARKYQLSEYFNVEIDSEEHAIVLYDPEKSLDAYRRWSMCADWAGNVEYCLVELDG